MAHACAVAAAGAASPGAARRRSNGRLQRCPAVGLVAGEIVVALMANVPKVGPLLAMAWHTLAAAVASAPRAAVLSAISARAGMTVARAVPRQPLRSSRRGPAHADMAQVRVPEVHSIEMRSREVNVLPLAPVGQRRENLRWSENPHSENARRSDTRPPY